MKAFSFRLEKILNLRKFNEDEAKIELGRTISILTELESKLLALGRERARAAALLVTGISAVEMQQYMFYIIRLDYTKEQLLEEIALAEMKVEEARKVFIEASKERKILDKLKEKRFAEHRKTMLQAEDKALDDVSSTRHGTGHFFSS